MKKVDYNCNICDELLFSSKDGKVKKTFVGFEFGYPKFITKVYWDVERHICFMCLNGLGILLDNKHNDHNWMIHPEEK